MKSNVTSILAQQNTAALQSLQKVDGATPASVESTPKMVAPDVLRTPLPEAVNVGAAQRQGRGQLAVRGHGTHRPHPGTRTKKLKTDKIAQLTRLEETSFGPVTEHLKQVLGALRSQVGETSGRDATELHAAIDQGLQGHRAAFSGTIQQAVRGPRSTLTKAGIDAMRASGADTLMFQVLVKGQLDMGTVRSEMTRMHEGIKNGELSVADTKKGLVTADGLLQRFALAGVDVQHSFKNNGPRDLLLSFASSLHR